MIDLGWGDAVCCNEVNGLFGVDLCGFVAYLIKLLLSEK